MCSIRFQSCNRLSQFKAFHFAWMRSFALLAVYFGSLSCCAHKPISLPAFICIFVDKVSVHLEFILLLSSVTSSINNDEAIPEMIIHGAKAIALPPQCFTDEHHTFVLHHSGRQILISSDCKIVFQTFCSSPLYFANFNPAL